MSSRKTISSSENDKLIKDFRDGVLRTSQEEFAGNLDVTRVAVLRWEAGAAQPSAENYIRMAKLAQERGHSEWAIKFWSKAGVDSVVLRNLVPEIEKNLKRSRALRTNPPKSEGGLIGLPLLEPSFFHGSHESVISRLGSINMETEGIESFVPFPKALIPDPHAAVAVRAPDDYMRPIFRRGNIVAVDVSFSSIAPIGSDALEKAITGKAKRDWGAWAYRTSAPIVAAYLVPSRDWKHLRAGLHLRTIHLTDSHAPAIRVTLGTQVEDIYRRRQEGFPNLAVPPEIDAREAEESRDATIAADPAWSILGNVVGWIASARLPNISK